ncbi:hypothetical protein [Streptomyces sp. NPDC057557]|uniref:hypothetical protein n=1 Tax=Streptomyces sp. NPDC057557 TaxID=3346167 RepID=UPI0036C76924
MTGVGRLTDRVLSVLLIPVSLGQHGTSDHGHVVPRSGGVAEQTLRTDGVPRFLLRLGTS